MNEYSLESLYGVTLQEYCQRHGHSSPQPLISKITIDIEILEENYRSLAERNSTLTDKELDLAKEISTLLHKKKQHRQRLRKWLKESGTRK
jgi:hypothetical protein